MVLCKKCMGNLREGSILNYEHLILVFNHQGSWVNAPDGKCVGKGVFEKALEEQGFEKSELKKLCKASVLKRVTTRHQNSWRTTYVLPMQGGPELK